ncbi:hypothetical protein JCM3765_001688 [Sporobolomyces pararoseus]
MQSTTTFTSTHTLPHLPRYTPPDLPRATLPPVPSQQLENAVPSTSNGSILPPLPPTLPSSQLSERSGNDSVGTAENPLIPKRRRRTSPTELAILEEEYQRNQRPDQPERAKIAQRLGMTNRAIQVWYQNRRQKDKKDSSSSNAGSSRGSSVASGDLSSPKDLDGVTLSFSSSPVPSPHFPLYNSAPPSRPPLVAATSTSTSSLKGLPSSSDLYATTPFPSSANKENNSVAPPLEAKPPVPQVPKPYVYSYPSSKETIAAYQLAASSAMSSSSSSSQQPVFIHRSSDSSIIAAKKHVRKRPLGSHAPIARTPSLSHAFAFPPSPPKPARASNVPARSSSVGNLPSTTAAKINLAELSARRPDLGRRASSLNTTSSSSPSLFDFSNDPSRQERSRQASAEEEAKREEGEGARKAAADDLLQHMQSDPPCASSPVAALRTRNVKPSKDLSIAVTDEDSDEDDKTPSGSFIPSAFAARRPPLQHTQSLGPSYSRTSDPRGGDPSKAQARVALLRSNSFSGTSSSPSSSSASASPLTISPALANSHARSNPFSPLSAPLSSRTIPRKSPSLSQAVEAARAGPDNACALTALERKRARIISGGLPLSLPSLPTSSSSSSSRRKSTDPSKERATKRRRSSALSSISQNNEADDSMGDLSFSSTSTASTVDSLATIDSPPSSSFPGGYFALKSAVEQVEGKEIKAAGDDERECAALLLGLGRLF